MIDRVAQIAPNLHRWLTPSTHWREGDDEETGGWAREVGSLLYEHEGAAIVFDPQIGADDPELCAFLDERVGAAERVVVALNGEVVYWLPEHAAIVSGEVFHGRPDGLRIAPDPYLVSREALDARLRALDRLPVTLVLPAHGPPAPDGPDVIRRALERPPWQLPVSG